MRPFNQRAPHWFRTHWLRVLGAAIACLAMAVFTAQPALAEGGLIRDSETEEMLRDFATPVWRAANLDPNDVRVYIVNDPSLNAFVAGGENIFVHTGLILAAENPNQLIGVVAHETGHIAGGHLARSSEAMRRSMGPALISIGLGILAIAGGAGDAGAALISGAPAFAQGNFVRHTQVQESSADQAAMSYLEETGQSGEGLIDFFNRNLRRYEFDMRRAPPYMITHPFTSDRVAALRERVESAPHRNAVDSPESVHRLQMVQAKLYGFLMTPQQTLFRYPTSDQSQPARYARALAAYRDANIAEARSDMQALIAEEPNNPYFHELHAQILFENGHAAEAVPESRRALDLRPNDSLLMVA
ncbi:MAG: M48 family metalloprotease, partial [Hyphomonadaceae bacterium]